MDYLSMLKPEEIREFTDNLNYKTDFIGDQLFPNIKSGNMKVAMRSIMEGGLVPVMAQVHALDTEARIGERPSFQEITLEKLLIKEKLNQTERMAEFIDSGASDSEIKKLVFDDIANLVSRVLTRVEAMKMELLATGKLVIRENNASKIVEYGIDGERLTHGNSIFDSVLKGGGSVISAIEKIKAYASARGYTLKRAICSPEFITEVLAKDAGIVGFLSGANVVPTEKNVRNWVNDNFGIDFVPNGDVYKTSLSSEDVYRFFPKNVITFVATKGTIGNGVFGVTPEERRLRNGSVSEKSLVTASQWINEDPVAVWTKASAIALPVPKDPNGIFITTCTIA